MVFRKAVKDDLTFIIQMLADDKLGSLRESYGSPISEKYYQAFDKIAQDQNQELIVIENESNKVIGTLQLTFIQYLTYQGGLRAQVEAVHIREDQRGKGVGEMVFKWAIERAREKGAHLLQLTTDKQRPDAIRFYEKLGFRASHEGMKLHLS